MPWDLAESQRISGKCWPKVAGFLANQATDCTKFTVACTTKLDYRKLQYLQTTVPAV